MRRCTLLISDVHADLGALEAILRLARDPAFVERYGRVERTLNLGDVVQRGYHPCEVIDRMKGIERLESVRGNHDEAFMWSQAVSGSDERSRAAHADCRVRGGWQEFFGPMPAFRVDQEERLYAVHGGPLDPGCCPDQEEPLAAWLNSRAWQRISDAGVRYFDLSGYHYLPADAFDAVRDALGPGFAILCGHEHAEAAYRERNGAVDDILPGLATAAYTAAGRRVEARTIALEDDANYLVRLGLAGPEGYYARYGWDRCYFGVYYRDDERRSISLLSFPLGRAAVPP